MLVEQHLSAIYRLAAAIVGEASAPDVTQETFVKAWQELPHLRDPAAFERWLRRICVNRSSNWLRSQRRRPDSGSFEVAEATTAGPGDFRGPVEARAVLEPAFERLTPDQRAVLALHYSLGYTIAEAADALGVPEGTAKSRLNAALGVLRSAIGAVNEQAEPEAAS
jgi:RNA polymerase sigma-70 factor, ECF subfamily